MPDAGTDSPPSPDGNVVIDGGSIDGGSIDGGNGWVALPDGTLYQTNWELPPPSEGTLSCTRVGSNLEVTLSIGGSMNTVLQMPSDVVIKNLAVGGDNMTSSGGESCWLSHDCKVKTSAISPVIWSDNVSVSNNHTPPIADGVPRTEFGIVANTIIGTTIGGEDIPGPSYWVKIRYLTVTGCVRKGCGVIRPGEVWTPAAQEYDCVIDGASGP
jgi:hypothetical protein